jgi:hypothetical protein
MDGSGTATIAALKRPNRRRETLVALRHPAHASWTRPVKLASPGGPPTARIDHAGDVLVGWRGQAGLKASYRPRPGHWSTPKTVTRRVDFFYDLSLGDSGDATFVWNHNGRIKARSFRTR